MSERGRRALIWTAVVCLYTAGTLAYFWPLPRLWGDHIGPDLGDPLFNLYVLKWGAHQIRLGLPDLWNANIFYPTRGALAFSDHLLGPAAQLVLFETAIPNAIAGYNFLFLSSFVGSALAVCWVLRRSGLSWTAAVLAGWMYAYSSFRLSQAAHLQILLAQWIPLTLWFWDRLLAERTVKNAVLFLLFYLLNLTGGSYFAYMIHFCLLAILVSRALVERRALLSFPSLRVLVPVALVAGMAAAALFLPYVRISRAQGLTRSAAETEEYSARLASYFSPSGENLYFGERADRLLHAALGEKADLFYRPESSLFAGFLPTILFFVAAWAAVRQRGPADPWARGLALSGLVCFALSFARVYVPLSRIIPGLSGMRVPARFDAFVSLTVVFFAARGVDLLLHRVPGPRARAAVAAGLAVILAVELAPRGYAWEPVPREEELPEVYRWLRDQPDVKGLVELPLYGDSRENDYLYAATVHWKPIANGYSGYMAESYLELANRIRFLPGPAAFDLLRRLGISHLVVHARQPKRVRAVRSWEERFTADPERQMEKVYESDGVFVYRVLDAPAAPRENGS
ncbi:MAG: hypothetical protein QOF89_1922 [Acidobacteriota bacterium]|jgi:hypothetical protein|nr:hypothetical protein [Acidobacteriota bacterium]